MIWAMVVQLPKLGKASPDFNWGLSSLQPISLTGIIFKLQAPNPLPPPQKKKEKEKRVATQQTLKPPKTLNLKLP